MATKQSKYSRPSFGIQNLYSVNELFFFWFSWLFNKELIALVSMLLFDVEKPIADAPHWKVTGISWFSFKNIYTLDGKIKNKKITRNFYLHSSSTAAHCVLGLVKIVFFFFKYFEYKYRYFTKCLEWPFQTTTRQNGYYWKVFVNNFNNRKSIFSTDTPDAYS